MLLPMLVLSLPPTSCLSLLPPLGLVASNAWSAVAAFGTGFAVGTTAIAVLYNPCSLNGRGGDAKRHRCSETLLLLAYLYDMMMHIGSCQEKHAYEISKLYGL